MIYQELKQYGKVKTNEPLAKHTTFKIGGPADFFVTVNSIEKLKELLSFLDAEGVDHMILGGGSNMLASDEGYRGVVIYVNAKEIQVDGETVIADAGAITVQVAQESIKAGLTGFEWGVGVPGTIGGAVRGNAGAMGGEMKDSVEKVDVYIDGEVAEYTNEDCQFGYRDSIFKHAGGTVLRVYLALSKTEDKTGMSTQGGSTSGRKKMLEYLKYRNTTQPQGYASTGCMFKNPDTEEYKEQLLKHFDEQNEKVQQFLRVGKISAGWLVEQVGMKGEQVGNAKVSERHGNFIVNLGDATAKDVLSLVERIKQKVYTTYGINLEEEIYIV